MLNKIYCGAKGVCSHRSCFNVLYAAVEHFGADIFGSNLVPLKEGNVGLEESGGKIKHAVWGDSLRRR